MKRTQISSTGTINNEGRLLMYMGEINDFCRQHKGERVVVRFEAMPMRTSQALRGYYYNYVVPTFRRAIWESGERKTEEDAERFLREISPVAIECTPDVETGRYTRKLREITEMSNAELIEHIETLKQIGAEEYNIYIEDPRTL